jgi:hypothetical protein
VSEQLTQEIFRRVAESIEVASAPYDAVLARAAQRRRRAVRTVVAAAVALVAVVGVATWAARRDPEPAVEPGPARVTEAANPADVAWYAGGLLHLSGVTVELPRMTDLAEVDGGAVYGDVDGTVAYVSATGTRTVLGEKDPGTSTIVSDEHGWAAWVGAGRLVLWDVAAGEEVDELPVEPGTRVVVIDQDRVYLTTGADDAHARDLAWTPGADAEPLDRSGLLDAESATRVYAVAGGARIEMVQSLFGVSFRRPGTGADLSPGGLFVLTRRPGSSDNGPFVPMLYDARSGDLLPSGLDRGELALDATFGPHRTLAYLVVRSDDLAAGADLHGDSVPLVVLRTCDLVDSTCHDVIPLARPGETPLLAD